MVNERPQSYNANANNPPWMKRDRRLPAARVQAIMVARSKDIRADSEPTAKATPGAAKAGAGLKKIPQPGELNNMSCRQNRAN